MQEEITQDHLLAIDQIHVIKINQIDTKEETISQEVAQDP